MHKLDLIADILSSFEFTSKESEEENGNRRGRDGGNGHTSFQRQYVCCLFNMMSRSTCDICNDGFYDVGLDFT